jgi:endoglucanase
VRAFAVAIAAAIAVLAFAATPPSSAAPGNPLATARWFINHQYGLAERQARAWRSAGRSDLAALMEKIASFPQTERYGGFTPDVGTRMRRYLAYLDQSQPGSLPFFGIYRLRHTSCGGYADSGSEQAAYRRWIDALAQAIGGHRAVVFLEQDSLLTVGCLSRRGLKIRLSELRYATSRLSALPNTVTYLDGGAADGGHSAGEMIKLLRRAGVGRVRGFFLNSTHYDWTSRELRFGDRIARALGKHFVVSTAANGRGPLVPRNRVRRGNEVLCNPSGRALGPRPTTNTGDPLADAFVWIGNPGRSGGACHRGDPPTGAWYPNYAVGLAARADY